MTQVQFVERMHQKVSKHKKIRALQDALINLRVCEEGVSDLLSESIDTMMKVLPKEHVFNDGNDWEVKP